MHARNRTWLLGSDPVERCRQRTLPVEGGDGSTLSLDFTTGVLDPRLQFTRSTNATFINSQGLVQWADANMFPNSAWNDTTANNVPTGWSGFNLSATAAVTVPVGDTESRRISVGATSEQPFIFQAPTVAQGITYTASVEIVSTTQGSIPGEQIQYNQVIAAPFAVAGSFTYYMNGASRGTGTGQVVETGILTLVYVAGSSSQIRVGFASNSRANCSMVVKAPQHQPGTEITRTAFFRRTSAEGAYYGPRFDYDPTTLQPLGLLIEGSAVNYVLQSGLNPFASPTWQTAGTTLPTTTTGYTGNGFAPDNTSRPTRVQFAVNGGSASRIFQQTSYTTNPTTAAPYTVSVWMKSNTAGTNYTINILGTAGSSAVTVTPTWQRFTVVNTSGTSLVGYVYISNESGSVAADVLIWGAQLEAGNGASSYIPTGASTGSRAADNCQLLDLTTMGFNANAGTVYLDVGSRLNSSGRSYTFLPTSGVTDQIFEGGGSALNVYTSGAFVAQIGGSTVNAQKIAVAYAANDFASSTNGAAVATDTVGSLPTTLAKLTIGGSIANPAGYLSGRIRVFKYWPTRLPNAQLQTLTT
jgi:hypothetical protein